VSGQTPEKYGEVVQRLEEVVKRLEGGELPLEESLQAFEEGIRLIRRGEKLLSEAEKRIDQLLTEGGQEKVIPLDLPSVGGSGSAERAKSAERPTPRAVPANDADDDDIPF
jgi:exodeoxyribonuclease VII small subunit